jgi:hypothetical protein
VAHGLAAATATPPGPRAAEAQVCILSTFLEFIFDSMSVTLAPAYDNSPVIVRENRAAPSGRANVIQIIGM